MNAIIAWIRSFLAGSTDAEAAARIAEVTDKPKGPIPLHEDPSTFRIILELWDFYLRSPKDIQTLEFKGNVKEDIPIGIRKFVFTSGKRFEFLTIVRTGPFNLKMYAIVTSSPWIGELHFAEIELPVGADPMTLMFILNVPGDTVEMRWDSEAQKPRSLRLVQSFPDSEEADAPVEAERDSA